MNLPSGTYTSSLQLEVKVSLIGVKEMKETYGA